MKRLIFTLAALISLTCAFAAGEKSDSVIVQIVLPNDSVVIQLLDTSITGSPINITINPRGNGPAVNVPAVNIAQHEPIVISDSLLIVEEPEMEPLDESETVTPDTPAVAPAKTSHARVPLSEVYKKKAPLPIPEPKLEFAWGADAGASIDMTGNDMSSIDFSAEFGMRRSWINFLGIGVGADIPVSNSCRYYPIFVDFKTNFSRRPSLLFWDLKVGVSLNYLEYKDQQAGIYCSTGIGFNLARGKGYNSYMIVGYTYRGRKNAVISDTETHLYPNLHYAKVKIGVSF